MFSMSYVYRKVKNNFNVILTTSCGFEFVSYLIRCVFLTHAQHNKIGFCISNFVSDCDFQIDFSDVTIAHDNVINR